MKYALLGYDLDRSLDDLAAPEKRALHGGHGGLNKAQNTSSGVTVVAHYRFRLRTRRAPFDSRKAN